MEETVLHQLVSEANKGNQVAREQLILLYRSQIAAAAARICGRPLDWNNDDELSIGLIAFNEAINCFNPESEKSFWNYAQMVMHHRLVDYFRREAGWKTRTVPVFDGQDEYRQFEHREAVDQYRRDETAMDQAEMMASFQDVLSDFKISLDVLVKDSPKHRDTKLSLMKAAMIVQEYPELLQKLMVTKQLPIKELMLVTGLSRKVLETGRRYIIALTLILTCKEFHPMRSFVKFSEGKEGEAGG